MTPRRTHFSSHHLGPHMNSLPAHKLLVRPVSFSASPPRCFPAPETVHSSTVPSFPCPWSSTCTLAATGFSLTESFQNPQVTSTHPGGEAHGQEQGHQYTGALAAASSLGGPCGASTEAKGRGSSMGFFKSVYTSPAHRTH